MREEPQHIWKQLPLPLDDEQKAFEDWQESQKKDKALESEEPKRVIVIDI